MDYGYSIDDSDFGRDLRTGAATLNWSDTLAATATNAWVHNPTTEIGDVANEFLANNPWARGPVEAIGAAATALPVIGAPLQAFGATAAMQPGGDADRLIDPHTLNQLYGKSLGLSFDTPQRKGAVDLIVAAKREQNQRDYILAHGPQGFSSRAANFLTTLAVSATDPMNIAAAFVPIVGETRAAMLAERLGATLGRFTEGAVSGGTVTAAYQPLEGLRDYTFQDQYGPLEAFQNVAFGTLLGGGLHASLGALADRMLGTVKPETRDAALTAAVAQQAEGRPVDVGAVMASDVTPHAATPEPGITAADLETALADVKIARSAKPSEPSLLDAIKANGGVRTADVAGNRVPEAGDIEAALQDKNRPGLINNQSGLHLDKMRENLTLKGWLNSGIRDAGLTDLNELLDKMHSEAQGAKIYHPESTIHEDLAYRELLDREFSEAGIGSRDSAKVAAQKLAEYRQGQSAAMLADHASSEIDAVLHDLSPTDQQVLQSHGYEPGADIGAEFEGGVAQGGLGGPEPFAPGQGNGPAGARQATGSGQVPAQFADALDRSRSDSARFTRGQEPGSAVSPDASREAAQDVKTKAGDDAEVEYQNALAQVADYERQGVLTKAEADQARSAADGLIEAKETGDAAKAAANCLFLHP